MSYDSVTSNTERLAKCKNFTLFYSDLKANTLPQWMFITPNMSSSSPSSSFCSPLMYSANDGHDTSVTTAGAFAKNFLTPLLSNQNFMKNTLIQLSSSLHVFSFFFRGPELTREQHSMNLKII